MTAPMTLKRSFRARAAEVFNAPIRFFTALMSSLCCSAMLLAPTLCAKIKTELNMDTLFGNMVNIITKIAFYVGALLTVGGVFALILAYKDDNADGQTRAVRLIVIGIILIGFEAMLKLAGIIG